MCHVPIATEAIHQGQVLTDITNRMVSLHREHFGRGPAAGKTIWVDDVVVVTLSDPFAPVERTLINAGKREQVRETRLVHQLALADVFKAEIEALTGREVVAFVSGVHFEPDLATEVFHLAA
jgi:uncharacterized protein YbcI